MYRHCAEMNYYFIYVTYILLCGCDFIDLLQLKTKKIRDRNRRHSEKKPNRIQKYFGKKNFSRYQVEFI